MWEPGTDFAVKSQQRSCAPIRSEEGGREGAPERVVGVIQESARKNSYGGCTEVLRRSESDEL